MVQARDTDNIPQIPGVELHPNQVAEAARLAALQKAAAANAEGAEDAPVIPLPTPESVKDMSGATRQILERIGDMLRQAPTLDPSGAKPENRAEAGTASSVAANSSETTHSRSETTGSVAGSIPLQ